MRNIVIALVLIILSSLPVADSSIRAPIANFKATGVNIYETKFKGIDYDIVYVNLQTATVKIFWKDETGKRFGSIKKLEQWLQAHNQQMIAATNAGIYDKDYSPVGLYVEQGRVLHNINLDDGYGNFFLKPNGIFFISKMGANVVESSEFKNFNKDILEATQSGPMLLNNGKINSQFSINSENRVIRSGVGVKNANEIYFVISKQPNTFYDFAELFKEQLNCYSALYLDGHISKLYIPHQNRFDDGDFVGILGVFAK